MENNDCIFCKIVRGEAPSYKVYEDENFLCFLSIKPLSPGFILVIPKDHHRWVWDVPDVGEYFEVARKMALVLKKAFNTESVWGHVQGDEIFHAHIWVYPNPDTTLGDKMDFESNLKKIKDTLS